MNSNYNNSYREKDVSICKLFKSFANFDNGNILRYGTVFTLANKMKEV